MVQAVEFAAAQTHADSIQTAKEQFSEKIASLFPQVDEHLQGLILLNVLCLLFGSNISVLKMQNEVGTFVCEDYALCCRLLQGRCKNTFAHWLFMTCRSSSIFHTQI